MPKNSTPQYVIDPIFDFQVICDTDIGLYRLIRKEYYDKNIFRKELFETNDVDFIKTVLLCREHFNPLTEFCKKGKLSDLEMDDLYRQFLDQEYDKILDLSIPYSIMSIASMSNNMNKIVNVVILCKSEKEKEWVARYDSKLKCIISDYKDFNLDKYDTLYIKDLYNLLLLDQDSIKKKNIIFPRFKFNLETEAARMELPIIEVAQKYYKENKFVVADPYKGISEPISGIG